MANWFDMELPEGWECDPADHPATAEKMPDGRVARFVAVSTMATLKPVAFLYENGRVWMIGTNAEREFMMPTLQDAKKYIIMRCALNTWGEE